MTQSKLTNRFIQLSKQSENGKLRDKKKEKKSTFKMSTATTEEIENLPNHPEILLIDVRDPPEIKSTGSIPTSINIPCKLKIVEKNMYHLKINNCR